MGKESSFDNTDTMIIHGGVKLTQYAPFKEKEQDPDETQVEK